MSLAVHRSLAGLVAAKAQSDPSVEILTFVSVQPDGRLADERRTYPELFANAQALAHTLRGLGVADGSVFAIMMQNHPEFVETMVAASILGACFVPIDPRTMGEKLAYMLGFVECQGIICTDECLDAVMKSGAARALHWFITLGATSSTTGAPRLMSYAAAIAPRSVTMALARCPADAPMFLMYTSGTTGNPKAVLQTHGNYMAAAEGMKALGITEADRLYTGLSLTHINAQGTLRSGLALSVPVVISRKFTKSRLWEICKIYCCILRSIQNPKILWVDDAEIV